MAVVDGVMMGVGSVVASLGGVVLLGLVAAGVHDLAHNVRCRFRNRSGTGRKPVPSLPER